VYEVRTTLRPPKDVVYYTFYANNTTEQYTGILTTRIGLYKAGDVIDISYMPANPRRSTMQGAWQSNVILYFGIAIALFVLFAVYKLYEMVQTGAA
jgi:hypothetical protein